MRRAVILAATLLGGCVYADGRPDLPPAPVEASAQPPAGMQYLYGSGEAGALSIAVYHALIDYARERIARRPGASVVLGEASTLDAPRFEPCGDRPFAAVFDVDETMIANLGFEYFDARSAKGYDAKAWEAWEKTGADKVAPIPGAVTAVKALRDMGVTVIFSSNRDAAYAAQTAAAIWAAGLGEAVHGETLYLKGDDNTGSMKDNRRRTIAEHYCVIAMAGDQLGDFSDLFNLGDLSTRARRAAATGGWAARLWGNGWFVLPNPVYGSGLKGGFDDVFPIDKRWDNPAEETK